MSALLIWKHSPMGQGAPPSMGRGNKRTDPQRLEQRRGIGSLHSCASNLLWECLSSWILSMRQELPVNYQAPAQLTRRRCGKGLKTRTKQTVVTSHLCEFEEETVLTISAVNEARPSRGDLGGDLWTEEGSGPVGGNALLGYRHEHCAAGIPPSSTSAYHPPTEIVQSPSSSVT